MTVRCLNIQQKRFAIEMFESKIFGLDDIAYRLEVSRRTVIRVLEEAGIDPGIRRRTRKEVIPTQVAITTTQTVEPWYRRLLNSIRQIFDPATYADRPYQ